MMMPLNEGDATFTSSFTKLGWDEAGNLYQAGFKPPKGEKFVVMLLGTAPKDATDYDLEAALARLGFVPGDTAVQNWDFFQTVTNYMAAHDLLQVDHEDGGGHEAALNVVAGIERLREAKEGLESQERYREQERMLAADQCESALTQVDLLRTMLEKILPLAEQHLDHELFGGSVKEMEAALELIREAKELLEC